MKTAMIASLATVLITSAATAGGRPTQMPPPPAPPAKVATACTFEAPQVSGYRGRASERKICYYDCGGTPTAIVIDAPQSCQHEQVIMIELKPALALLSRPCQGGRPCQYAE